MNRIEGSYSRPRPSRLEVPRVVRRGLAPIWTGALGFALAPGASCLPSALRGMAW